MGTINWMTMVTAAVVAFSGITAAASSKTDEVPNTVRNSLCVHSLITLGNHTRVDANGNCEVRLLRYHRELDAMTTEWQKTDCSTVETSLAQRPGEFATVDNPPEENRRKMKLPKIESQKDALEAADEYAMKICERCFRERAAWFDYLTSNNRIFPDQKIIVNMRLNSKALNICSRLAQKTMLNNKSFVQQSALASVKAENGIYCAGCGISAAVSQTEDGKDWREHTHNHTHADPPLAPGIVNQILASQGIGVETDDHDHRHEHGHGHKQAIRKDIDSAPPPDRSGRIVFARSGDRKNDENQTAAKFTATTTVTKTAVRQLAQKSESAMEQKNRQPAAPDNLFTLVKKNYEKRRPELFAGKASLFKRIGRVLDAHNMEYLMSERRFLNMALGITPETAEYRQVELPARSKDSVHDTPEPPEFAEIYRDAMVTTTVDSDGESSGASRMPGSSADIKNTDSASGQKAGSAY